MRRYDIKLNTPKPLISRQGKWIRGLNTLVSNTQVRPDELSKADDVQLVEDGKIQMPRDGQSYYGASSGSKVTGIFPYYKSDGTNELLRTAGTTLQKYGSGTWSNISGYAYTTGLNTHGATIFDRVYLCNGTDPLTYYDGSTIVSFTAISKPTGLGLTRTAGSTGTYTFSYKVSAVTAVGETDPTDAATIAMSVDTLSATAKITVAWTASTNAIGYIVYGRKDGRWYKLKYLEGNTSVSYVDDATDAPDEYTLPQSVNTTSGPAANYVEVYRDTLFLAGDPDNPSRLYYSAGGDLINDFSTSTGGGFIDVAKNDGQTITGLIKFKSVLLVFKTDSTYQFSFSTSGLPQVELVNPAIGCVAPRSLMAVENDIFFASRRGIFTIGNEAGFSFDVLRTNELSSRVRSIYETIDPSRLSDIAGIYATKNNKNLVIFSYTPTGSSTNSEAIVYDRERLGWLHWTNIKANCFTQYVDSTGQSHVLYGDDSSGYVKEMFEGNDDFGTAINGIFRLRAEAFNEVDRYKNFKNVFLTLRQPTGNTQINLITDGVTTAQTISMSTISPVVNWGHYLFTGFTFGDSVGDGASAQDDNIVKRIRNANLQARSLMLEFDNQSSGKFILLGVTIEAKPKSLHFYESGEVVN